MTNQPLIDAVLLAAEAINKLTMWMIILWWSTTIIEIARRLWK